MTVSWLTLAPIGAPLIAVVAFAIRRSARRLEAGRLRDELIDAVRTGALDVTDPRVRRLIDWFDQVADTGRPAGLDAPGDPDRSVAASLEAALTAPHVAGSATPPRPDQESTADLLRRAVHHREKWQTAAVSGPVGSTAADPAGPLWPGSGVLEPLPRGLSRRQVRHRAAPAGSRPPRRSDVPTSGAPSLVEEIFAVAQRQRTSAG